jgi:AGCS family alanine or glycine:cation symporter
MGIMAIINLPVIVLLGKTALNCLEDYVAQRKAGKDPVFHSKNIGLDAELDFWK